MDGWMDNHMDGQKDDEQKLITTIHPKQSSGELINPYIHQYLFPWIIQMISLGLKNNFESAMVNKPSTNFINFI